MKTVIPVRETLKDGTIRVRWFDDGVFPAVFQAKAHLMSIPYRQLEGDLEALKVVSAKLGEPIEISGIES